MTKKQELFIDSYIKTKNASKSAREAGYSMRTAYSMGQQNLNKIEIKTEIEKRFEELKKKYDISMDDYIKRTLVLHEETKHPSTKQRYWELLGKIYGYTKETITIEGIKPTNITNIVRTNQEAKDRVGTNNQSAIPT